VPPRRDGLPDVAQRSARVLRDRYDLAWGVMHEGAWMRLYVKGMNPDQAAE